MQVFSWMNQRPIGTATTWTGIIAVIAATDWAKTAKKQQIKTATMRVYTFIAWTIWFRNYYVTHAFVVCNDYYSVCDVFELYDNNIWPRLIYIILYFKHITCADDFPLNGYTASFPNLVSSCRGYHYGQLVWQLVSIVCGYIRCRHLLAGVSEQSINGH